MPRKRKSRKQLESAREVDLHGLLADEAERKIRSELFGVSASLNDIKEVVFVHGYRGGTVLKETVRRVAEEHGKEWIPHPFNEGKTKVFL